MTDHYKQRLKKAAWGWMESYSWRQGKFLKDRVFSRSDKRGARYEWKRELPDALDEVSELRFWDLGEWG